MHIRYPNTKPTPNEKIVFKDLPPWVSDQEILTYLRKQPGIIVKSGVISARFRDTQNKLTPFFSGDRFVFVKGNLTQALHTNTFIDFAKCRIWHKKQELACKRCRMIGHLSTDTELCKAFINDQNIITIRSSNCVFSNYYMCYLKVFENEFSSSEQAYQWRFMTYIGLNELAKQVLEARTPDQAKEIASRVPRELHKNWHSIKLNVMKEILHAKADYNSRFKEELILSDGKKLVESTKDIFWASGMSPRDTTSTLPSFYPGLNQLGNVLNQVRSDLLNEAAQEQQFKLHAHKSGAMNLHVNIQAKNTDQSDLTHTITNISDTIPISPTPIPNDIMDLLVTPISAPTDTLKDKITEHTSTSIHCMSDMSSDSEEDDYDNIMSGVEELSIHSDDDSTNNELPVTPTLEAIQETNVTLQHSTSKQIRPIEKKNTDKSSQQTITTMFQAMKRKLTPGKADDASQDNQKMQRNDLTS